MKYLFIIIITFLSSLCIGQNLVSNGSFEDGNYDYSDPLYVAEEYRDHIDDWSHDGYYPLNPNNASGHSPDWFYEDYKLIYTDKGEHFIGFNLYELIQQNLSSTVLENSIGYKISAYVYLVNPFHTSSGTNTYEGYDLKFYLSDSKIAYNGHQSNMDCDEDYRTLSNTSIKNIKTFDLGIIENQKWIKLDFQYIEPSSSSGLDEYDWFGLQIVSDELTCYEWEVLIDKVVITEIDQCTFDACSRTDGVEVASGVYRYGNWSGPAAVKDLDNIQTAENIQISTVLGQVIETIPDVYSLNGIANPIIWDGKDGNGTYYSPGTYIWNMDLINSCGNQDYSNQFVINTPFSYSNLPQFDDYNNNVETPIPCCPDGQDVLIDYVLYGSGVIEYVAISDITLEDMSVESSVDKLVLQAGDGVIFQSDVLINAGTEVDILIEPCLFVQ